MVGIPFFGGSAPPAVRRPTFAVNLGSASADTWAGALVSLAVEVGLAPAVDALTLQVANEARAPGVAVGDSGTVELGYEDSGNELVFTGQVDAVQRSLAGTTRITVVNGGATLARLRLDRSFQQQTAGGIVQALLGEVGLSADGVEDGIDYPFYVIDAGRNAYQHIARLARRNGYLAYLTPEGKLSFAPFAGGQAEQTFSYASDILALDLADATPAAGSVTTTGEGAAGSQGSDAWSWLVKDPSGVQSTAGDGTALPIPDSSLRSSEAAQAAAEGLAGGLSLMQYTGSLLVPGTPAVTVGSAIEIADAPQSELNGLCLVRHLRHHFDKQRGFTTRILFSQTGAGGAGALGGLF
jgi:phage protein D